MSFELYERLRFRSAMTSELATLADILGANTAVSLTFNDAKSAGEALSALRAEHHIVAACLYDLRGAVLAEYHREGVGADLQMPAWREDGARFEAESLTLHRSVFVGEKKAGTIAIVSDLSGLQEKMGQYTKISPLVLLISVATTLLVSSKLLRLITEPILQLAAIAGRISTEEDYTLRADSANNDEVGELVSSFNRMLERIQEHDTALQEAKDALEFRVQERTEELRRKYGGTGLGLTICARLVSMMGGKMWVESEVGQGSQFHFTVRAGLAEAQKISVNTTVRAAQVLAGVKVLVVDDNSTNLRILDAMTRRWQMRTTSVDSGEKALEKLIGASKAGRPYQLILMDMHMPGMDGFSLVTKIRENSELSIATIMMLTSAGHRGDAER